MCSRGEWSRRWRAAGPAVALALLAACAGNGDPGCAACPQAIAADFVPYGRSAGEWLMVEQDGVWVFARLVDSGVLESEPPRLKLDLPEGERTVAVTAITVPDRLRASTLVLQLRQGEMWVSMYDWALARDGLLAQRSPKAAWELVDPALARIVTVSEAR